jgi:hypothetical protein
MDIMGTRIFSKGSVLAIVLVTLLIIVGTIYLVFLLRHTTPTKNLSLLGPSITPAHTSEALEVLSQLPAWVPDLQWGDSQSVLVDNGNGRLVPGYSRLGTGTSPENLVPDIHPKLYEELTKQGWHMNGPAEAPGSSSYRFTKAKQGKQQVIYVNYQTWASIVSKSDEPVRFASCPCSYQLTVLYSNSF